METSLHAELLPGFLELVRELTGARAVYWLAGEGDGWRDRPRIPAPGADFGLVNELAPSEFRVTEWPSRRPRLRASGVERLVLQAASSESRANSRPRGVLWLTEPSPRSGLDHVSLLPLAEHAAALHVADERRRREQLDVRRGQNSAGLLHDLRNELQLATLALTRHEFKSEPDAITQSLTRARNMCRQHLSGTDVPVACDLAGLLNEEVRLAARSSSRARRKLASGGVTVHGEITHGPWRSTLAVHQQSLRRVLRNLISNAVEASPPGERVLVKLELSTRSGPRFEVMDRGEGLDERAIERAFRAGGTRGGTGYGSVSLFDCLRELRAELEFHTAPGAGTRAVVVLPRCKAAQSS